MLIILILPIFLFAQENRIIENLLEENSKDADEAIILDKLEYYREFPINLNETNTSELSDLPNFSRLLSRKILKFIKKHEYLNYKMIADSLNLEPEQHLILEKCTYLGEKPKSQTKIDYRMRNFSKFEESRGFQEGIYKGDPWDVYQRIRLSSNYLDAGVLISKDAGEVHLDDYRSFYAKFKLKKHSLIAGNYIVESGMGTLFWRAFGARKGADVLSPLYNNGNGAKVYNSSIETGFLRGLAYKGNYIINKNLNLDINIFYSDIDRAASNDEETGCITSMYSSGYFRTENEINKKNSVNERVIGSVVKGNFKDIEIGFNAYNILYEKTIVSESSTCFNGRTGNLFSLFGNYVLDFAQFNSEIALDANSNLAIQSNFLVEYDKSEFLINFRSFDAEFRSPFGYKFGEFSYPANEMGFYVAVKQQVSDNVKIGSYVDFYRSKSRTFFVPTNVKGIDLFSRIEIDFGNKTDAFINVKYENKTDAFTDDEINQKIIYDGSRKSIRLDIEKTFSRNLFLRFRTEYAHIDYDSYKSTQDGFSTFLETRYEVFKNLKIGGRATLFSTDSYDSAIWQFEYAAGGYMTTRALYGEGSRYIFYINYKPIDLLAFTLRYSSMNKNNVKEIGSGYDLIQGNFISDLIFQIDFRL